MNRELLKHSVMKRGMEALEKNATEIFSEGYRVGYNQALVDKGFQTQSEADKVLKR